MISKEEAEAQVMVFLPAMIELEVMGYNPVDLMFNEKPPSIEEIEAVYVAMQRIKTKYPKCYAVMVEGNRKLKGE